jgi:hypothetical protein
MKKYRCKVYWEMCGEVTVKAVDETSACLKAMDAPLPSSDEQSYVSDSANCDPDTDVVEIK